MSPANAAAIDQSPLGKTTRYAEQYDASLLFPIARRDKRLELGWHGALPCFGADVWNAYELSWLNAKGKPRVALGRFTFSADSPCLIESKSLKLYLNSFNQTRFADSASVRERLVADLSAAAGSSVAVRLAEPGEWASERIGELEGYCIDELDVEIDCYQPQPHFLRCLDEAQVEQRLVSHLLKSNCLITGQPDWASVQVHYRGRPIAQDGLLRYLVSFRQHNEFHEQCVERIFRDIQQHCQPEALAVQARYTRRGGLDINPLRTNFTQAAAPSARSARQ